VHGSVKGIQENVILATGVNPTKLENNKKLQSDLMTYIATDMAVNATEQASCMLNDDNIHDLICVTSMTTDAFACIQ
jgi:hypothetical protein